MATGSGLPLGPRPAFSPEQLAWIEAPAITDPVPPVPPVIVASVSGEWLICYVALGNPRGTLLPGHTYGYAPARGLSHTLSPRRGSPARATPSLSPAGHIGRAGSLTI